MKSLKGIIGIISIVGLFATTTLAYSAQNIQQKNVQVKDPASRADQASHKKDDRKKNITPVVMLLEKPDKEEAGQYVTLSDPASDAIWQNPQKQITVKQSFTIKPSIVFNMGGFGRNQAGPSSPAGFSGSGSKASGQRITFLYGDKSQGTNTKVFGVSLGSQFLVDPGSVMSPLFDATQYSGLNSREVYNLSLDMGYLGFNFGASFSQERMLFNSGLKGFDVGLGYNAAKWGADVKFGEYKRERDRLFATTEEFYDTVYALEVGAEYRLYSNIRFTGRFTYYSYGEQNDLGKLRNSQVFFLGTNVNF